MKYLAFIGLFIAGGAVGYFVGAGQSTPLVEESDDTAELIVQNEPPRSTPSDRNEIIERIEENFDSLAVEVIDTTGFSEELDTLTERILPRDESEELDIKRDRMITTRRVPIVYLDGNEEKDSLIKGMLGIKENRPTDMILQFWESPLGYSGYKFSRNTVILYGLSDQFKYTIYAKQDSHYISTKEFFYVLNETNDFVSYKSVDRGSVLND